MRQNMNSFQFNTPVIYIMLAVLQLSLLCTLCHGFTPSSKSKQQPSKSAINYSLTATGDGSNNGPPLLQISEKNKPHWVPMELIELAADELSMSNEEFIQTYADIEAYTSCDDEGDNFHECDFFKDYIGPTKWLHLTKEARESVINDAHFSIWKDVWTHPHGAVDLADKVSKDVLRHYKEFMLEPRTSSTSTATKCPTNMPLVRVKVVPASFGLEGFEDAIWEATEDLMRYTTSGSITDVTREDRIIAEENDDGCRAITFIVAAPDLFTDPSLLVMDGNAGPPSSPQAEFEPGRFQEFASTIREKMVLFSKMEGVPLDDAIQVKRFHPLWRYIGLDGRQADENAFPYPCVAVSTKI